MTAYDIAIDVYEENIPIDWTWIKLQKKTLSKKELLEICKENIRFSFDDISQNMVGRAATALYRMLYERNM